MLNFKFLAGGIAIMVVMVTFILIQQSRIAVLRTDRDQAIAFNNSKNDSLISYVNKYGQQVAKTEVLELSARNLKKLLEDDRLSVVKYFNGVNKRLNNLERVTQVEAEYNKEVIAAIIPSRDSMTNTPSEQTFSYYDSLNSVSGWIRNDTVRVKIHADVPIYSVVYWQRRKNKWLLGIRALAGKEWFDETVSTNPSVTIKKKSSTQIKKIK